MKVTKQKNLKIVQKILKLLKQWFCKYLIICKSFFLILINLNIKVFEIKNIENDFVNIFSSNVLK